MRLSTSAHTHRQPNTLTTLFHTGLLALSTFHTAHAADLSFTLPPVPSLPTYNPSGLPPSTHATLFRHAHTTTTPLTRANTFEFRNLSAGSWLFTVQCRDYTFSPLRVDVLPLDNPADGTPAAAQTRKQKVEVFQTFWGNEWGNKGEMRASGIVDVGAAEGGVEDKMDSWEKIVRMGSRKEGERPVVVQVVPSAPKDYYMTRQGFSPLTFLKNPMILMGLVSLGLIVAIPYITNNMDEETRAEFEEMQRKSPISQAAAGGSSLQNFDLASWMAGKSTGNSTPRSSTPAGDERR